jgi:hypothetical protein
MSPEHAPSSDGPDRDPDDSNVLDRPAGPELTRTLRLFRSARGLTSDAEWAEAAFARMVFDGVRINAAESTLAEAADVVEDAQESPEELFGAPHDWARSRTEDLQREGLDVVEHGVDLGLRQGVVYSFGFAAGFTALFGATMVLGLLTGGGISTLPLLSFSLMPLLISAVILGLIKVYRVTTTRLRFVPAIAICAGFVIVCATVIANLLVLALNDLGPRVNEFWFLLLIPVYAGLCWLLSRLWPDPGAATSADAAGTTTQAAPRTPQDVIKASEVSDDDWERRAQTAMRLRGDLSERRVRQVLAEARAHGADGDRPLVEEFGSPEGYAQTVVPDPRVKPRRMMLLYLAVAMAFAATALMAILDDGGFTRATVGPSLGAALGVGLTITHGRRWSAARRQAALSPGDA